MNVIMFHSVGNESGEWYRNWLSVSLNHFDIFCKYLAKKKYQTGFLEDWYKAQNNQSVDSNKQIILTFDDGYLDNWVYVYPILKKYSLKGTIFINPEFVDPSNNVRFNIEDVWSGNISKNELSTLGFLNWPEIKAMDESGVIDIQSHSMSHNFYFHSNKINDIYTGQQKYDWIAWFLKPDRKPYYITEDQKNYVPYGFPVFEFGRALGLKRYFPDDRLIKYATSLFNDKSGIKDQSKTISNLNNRLTEYPGRFETDDEMESRYRYEIFESKRILEERLNKKVEYLCWPGGGYNQLSIKLSMDAGYKASTVASSDKYENKDKLGKYKRIIRFGLGSFMVIDGHRYLVRNKNWLVHNFLNKTGSNFYLNINRFQKLWFMIKHKLTV